ncbi:hypothetical protein [Klebsiella phage MY01]|nr:hypothetical protein [Pseudomonas phage MY01]
MRSYRRVVFDVVLLTLILSAIMIGFISAAYGSDSGIKPAFEKVDIQRVHDDDAEVTCWILYAPGTMKGTTYTSDSYSISCLPNSVINPKGTDK